MDVLSVDSPPGILEPLICLDPSCRFPDAPLPAASSPAYIQASLCVREIFRLSLAASLIHIGTEFIERTLSEEGVVGRWLAELVKMMAREADLVGDGISPGLGGEERLLRMSMDGIGRIVCRLFAEESRRKLTAELEGKVLAQACAMVEGSLVPRSP